jgi:hypothetical protein
MKRKWLGRSIGIVGLLGAAVWLTSLLSCARGQELTSITIVPSSFTYGSASTGGQQVPIPLTAYGTFIHPPATKDITTLVTWTSDVTPVADVDSTGHLTAGVSCGGANISATYYKDGGNTSGPLVVGFMGVTVDGPASLGCTPAGTEPVLSVNFGGTGTGTVVSSPAGIDCSSPSSCSASYPAGSTITLTGTPTGTSMSVTWNGCSSAIGTSCTVLGIQNNVAVTATFQ